MRQLAVLSAIPLLASCGGAVDHPAGNGGALQGTVFRGPVTPTCVKGQSCSRPAPGVSLGFQKGGYVAWIKTRKDGSYKIAIPAGRYSVTVTGAPVRPKQVSVKRGRVRHLDFVIDTRIR
jgi:hypothetical protein